MLIESADDVCEKQEKLELERFQREQMQTVREAIEAAIARGDFGVDFQIRFINLPDELLTAVAAEFSPRKLEVRLETKNRQARCAPWVSARIDLIDCLIDA